MTHIPTFDSIMTEFSFAFNDAKTELPYSMKVPNVSDKKILDDNYKLLYIFNTYYDNHYEDDLRYNIRTNLTREITEGLNDYKAKKIPTKIILPYNTGFYYGYSNKIKYDKNYNFDALTDYNDSDIDADTWIAKYTAALISAYEYAFFKATSEELIFLNDKKVFCEGLKLGISTTPGDVTKIKNLFYDISRHISYNKSVISNKSLDEGIIIGRKAYVDNVLVKSAFCPHIIGFNYGYFNNKNVKHNDKFMEASLKSDNESDEDKFGAENDYEDIGRVLAYYSLMCDEEIQEIKKNDILNYIDFNIQFTIGITHFKGNVAKNTRYEKFGSNNDTSFSIGYNKTYYDKYKKEIYDKDLKPENKKLSDGINDGIGDSLDSNPSKYYISAYTHGYNIEYLDDSVYYKRGITDADTLTKEKMAAGKYNKITFTDDEAYKFGYLYAYVETAYIAFMRKNTIFNLKDFEKQKNNLEIDKDEISKAVVTKDDGYNFIHYARYKKYFLDYHQGEKVIKEVNDSYSEGIRQGIHDYNESKNDENIILDYEIPENMGTLISYAHIKKNELKSTEYKKGEKKAFKLQISDYKSTKSLVQNNFLKKNGYIYAYAELWYNRLNDKKKLHNYFAKITGKIAGTINKRIILKETNKLLKKVEVYVGDLVVEDDDDVDDEIDGGSKKSASKELKVYFNELQETNSFGEKDLPKFINLYNKYSTIAKMYIDKSNNYFFWSSETKEEAENKKKYLMLSSLAASYINKIKKRQIIPSIYGSNGRIVRLK